MGVQDGAYLGDLYYYVYDENDWTKGVKKCRRVEHLWAQQLALILRKYYVRLQHTYRHLGAVLVAAQ